MGDRNIFKIMERLNYVVTIILGYESLEHIAARLIRVWGEIIFANQLMMNSNWSYHNLDNRT